MPTGRLKLPSALPLQPHLVRNAPAFERVPVSCSSSISTFAARSPYASVATLRAAELLDRVVGDEHVTASIGGDVPRVDEVPVPDAWAAPRRQERPVVV